jgi:hypothetical protein
LPPNHGLAVSSSSGSRVKPPAISSAVDAEQDVAALVGSAMHVQVPGNAPELHNNSTA